MKTKTEKRRLFLFYSLFGAVSLLLVLLLSEAAIRIFTDYRGSRFTIRGADSIYPVSGLTTNFHFTFDPVTGYSMIKGINDNDQQIHTDENGNRIVGKKFDPSLKSIVFVGDSTVFGWGVGDQDAYPYLLSQVRGLENYNIINTGVPSYSLAHIIATLQSKVPKLNPALVFVEILWPWKPFEGYSQPDAWKKIDFEFYKQTIPPRDTYQLDPPAIFTCLTCKMIRDIWVRVQYSKQIQQNLTRPGIRDFNLTPEQETWLAKEHIELFKQVQASLPGVKIVFFIHPYQYTVFHQDYQKLGQLGKSLFVESLNARDPTEFLKKEFNGVPLYIDGSHLTPAGHQVFCDFMIGEIKKQIPEIEASDCSN